MTGSDFNKCRLCGCCGDKIAGIEEPVYYHCGNCDLIYMDSGYYMTPEQEKHRYMQHNNTVDNDGYVRMFEQFMDKVVPEKLKDRVLDYGSGPVPVLKILLEKRGFDVDIYDPYFAPGAIYKGKKYGLITCTEAIEHIEDAMQTFEFFCEHLNPGARLAIMTLFHPQPRDFPTWWYKRDRTHVCFYSIKTFKWIEAFFPLHMVFSDDKNTVVFERRRY